MGTAYFVWLGSGRARRRKVAERGVFLDRAAQAGLPVPPGAILLQELFQALTEKGVIENRADRTVIPDPELLHNTLFYSVHLPRFTRPVVFAPLFTPDALPTAGAGSPPPHSPIDMNDPDQVTQALASLWPCAVRRSGGRADLLLMESIDAETTGQAYTLASEAFDRLEMTRSGPEPYQELPRIRGWLKPAVDLPPYARRLQMLLGGVRRTFGRGDWAIEWADDGAICWLRDLSIAGAKTGQG